MWILELSDVIHWNCLEHSIGLCNYDVILSEIAVL